MTSETTLNSAVGNSEEELEVLIELLWLDLDGIVSR